MNKRTFLKSTALFGLGSIMGLPSFGKAAESVTEIQPDFSEEGEDDFWEKIRAGYNLNPDYINLENGYYCIQPVEILEKYKTHINDINIQGARYMRTLQADRKRVAAQKLAGLAGCPPDQLIITRNTTESLDMIISGFDWKAGDEAIMAEQDYGAMLDMFKQTAKRHHIVCKSVSIPLHPVSDDEIVSLYESAITTRTKLLMVCHMVNITGQILPVRKICDMAHRYNVQVMVDGANALAQLVFSISDLNCDYYGSSLHKWLSVPLGAGLLYMKKEHISNVWPLFAEATHKEDDIEHLNHTGTHPAATDITISDAIDYYLRIGPTRKEERLRYLQTYWTSKVRNLPNILLNTPAEPARACAIANVGVKGIKPADLSKILFDKYHIYTVAIDVAGVHGCRITPNVYTTTGELDKLVTALGEIAA